MFQIIITEKMKMQLRFPKEKKKFSFLTGIQKKMWIYRNIRCTKEFYEDILKKIKRNWNYADYIFMETCNDNKCLIE